MLQTASLLTSLALRAAALHHGAAALSTGCRLLTSKAGEERAKVGFIGLGRMGKQLATSLMESGHPLVLFDNSSVALDGMLEAAQASHPGRAQPAASPAAMASTPDVELIVTMLPEASAVMDVYLGEEGIVRAKGGIVPHVVLDCSTTGPVVARQIASQLALMPLSKLTRKVAGLAPSNPVMVDAPASKASALGTKVGQHSLSFMVGGPDAAVRWVEPFLRDMGAASVTHCGDHGDAQAAKLCNTLVLASTMAAVSEALALAKRLGVDPKVMTQILNSGAARTWVTENHNPVPGLNPGMPPSMGYRAGYRTDLVSDQLDMLVMAAQVAHSPAPIARATQAMYQQICNEGLGDADFSAVYRYVYGSGQACDEWAGGEKLFGAHAP